jgi:hypothetical protein
MKFYFNNKLHKHLRSDQHSKKHQKFSKNDQRQIANISIVISTRKHEDHKGFVFREHQYARVNEAFESKDKAHELCVDSRIFMSLIDRKFLKRNASQILIKKTISDLKIRDIESKVHDTSTYCSLDLYFQRRFKNQLHSQIAHITEEFHLVNDLQTNVLIDMNIMSSKKCILNFRNRNMIFFSCQNIEILVSIIRTEQSMNRLILATKKTMISSHINMTILVKVREKSLSERDYIFNPREKTLLRSEKEFFSHILVNNSVEIQMRNISNQAYVILKNYKIEKMNDYHESDCHVISSENEHLAIASNRLSANRRKMNSRRFQSKDVSEKDKSFETILLNDIIVHDEKESIARIVAIVNEYLNV